MVYAKLILDTRRKRPTGVYPIKLRITFNRQQKYYAAGYQTSVADFSDVMKDVPPKRLQELKIQLSYIELKAKNIILKLDAFSFMAFEERFFEFKKASKSIYALYEAIISEKMTLGKVSTAVNYQCSMKSLQLFAPRLSFVDLTPDFLKSYERHLLQQGRSISTVGFYLRPLRAVANEAISKKCLPRDSYPFGTRKYLIPQSRNIKRTITKDELKKIIHYFPDSENSYEARSQDFWVLSYLAQGANPKDLLLLKHENIEQGYIRFIRAKTKDTTRKDITEITVPLLPEMKAIIDKWKNNNASGYLFDFVTEDMSPLDVYKTIQQFVKLTNKHMALIAKKLGIQKRVTSYTARYQFTKAMIDAGISVEYIRQCLGHQSYATTKRYIDSFELVQKHEIAKKHLLNFD